MERLGSIQALRPSTRFTLQGAFRLRRSCCRVYGEWIDPYCRLRSASQKIYRAAYLQDDIHLTRKLTVNLGLRWELDGPFSERFNRLSIFQPNVASPLAQATGLNVMGNLALVDSGGPLACRTNGSELQATSVPAPGLAYQV